MRVHELHAAAVHAPLVLLPAAAIVDFSAAVTGNRRRDALGRALWWTGIGAAAVAGMAGMAASQETKADDPHTEDMMWLHGIGNTAILLGAVGVAIWRTGRRASLPQSIIGLAACGLSLFTAYLRRDGVRPRSRRAGHAAHRARGCQAEPAGPVGRRAGHVLARRWTRPALAARPNGGGAARQATAQPARARTRAAGRGSRRVALCALTAKSSPRAADRGSRQERNANQRSLTSSLPFVYASIPGIIPVAVPFPKFTVAVLLSRIAAVMSVL